MARARKMSLMARKITQDLQLSLNKARSLT